MCKKSLILFFGSRFHFVILHQSPLPKLLILLTVEKSTDLKKQISISYFKRTVRNKKEFIFLKILPQTIILCSILGIFHIVATQSKLFENFVL